MRAPLMLIVALVVGLSLHSDPGYAQANKKKAAGNSQPAHTVQGTAQLAGENGKIGVTYTLGKSSPYNFTLLDARYSASRVVIGGDTAMPKADEKLLVVDFTVQNPQKVNRGFDSTVI